MSDEDYLLALKLQEELDAIEDADIVEVKFNCVFRFHFLNDCL